MEYILGRHSGFCKETVLNFREDFVNWNRISPPSYRNRMSIDSKSVLLYN
jgi:hypothetical protein